MIRPRLCALGLLFLSAVAGASIDTAPVADAAMRRDAAAVRALLRQGADVNAAQGDGMTALHWAARHGDAPLVATLVHAGANLRAATRINGYTPLFLACQHGHDAVVETLLGAGASPNAASTTGSTPLMLAAASGDATSVRRLLDAGANVNARESARGQTALMFAAAANRVAVIDLLAARGADPGATTKVVDLYAFSQEDEGGRPVQPAPASGTAAGRTSGSPEPAGPPRAAGAGAQPAEPASSQQNRRRPQVAGVDRAFLYTELIGYQGGLASLHLAAREGHPEAVARLLDAGADINQLSAGDRTSPLLIATINGHFDIAKTLLDRGADPRLPSENGVTPLYAVLNVQWAPKANYPQPRAHLQQRTTYLDLMQALVEKGADPNARLKKKVWYSGYNSDLSGVDETGATPFWRAAYASDVEAMRLLMAHGADPGIPTVKPAGRVRLADPAGEPGQDVSGLPPVPVGGPSVTPLQAATGVGYSKGFAANSHRIHAAGWMPAVRYLVEELGADVNAADHEGNTALHHAASRGDNEMVLYLVSKGADVKAVNRQGQTTADMANGPVQRTQPYPETVALLVKLGAKNNNRCVSC
jgi:ankyrin repeat protein